MKPSVFPKKLVNAPSPAAKHSAKGLSEGCPFGTVPIKRVRREDLRGAKMLMENTHPTDATSGVYHVSHSFLIKLLLLLLLLLFSFQSRLRRIHHSFDIYIYIYIYIYNIDFII
jgi:hypothetical protein